MTLAVGALRDHNGKSGVSSSYHMLLIKILLIKILLIKMLLIMMLLIMMVLIMMERVELILSDAAHQAETTLQPPTQSSRRAARAARAARAGRVHCKKSKATGVTRFMGGTKVRSGCQKARPRVRLGPVDITREGVWWNLSGGQIWPMSLDIWSTDMTRQLKQPTKFQQSDCGIRFGPVEGVEGDGVASGHL